MAVKETAMAVRPVLSSACALTTLSKRAEAQIAELKCRRSPARVCEERVLSASENDAWNDAWFMVPGISEASEKIDRGLAQSAAAELDKTEVTVSGFCTVVWVEISTCSGHPNEKNRHIYL